MSQNNLEEHLGGKTTESREHNSHSDSAVPHGAPALLLQYRTVPYDCRTVPHGYPTVVRANFFCSQLLGTDITRHRKSTNQVQHGKCIPDARVANPCCEVNTLQFLFALPLKHACSCAQAYIDGPLKHGPSKHGPLTAYSRIVARLPYFPVFSQMSKLFP